MLARSLLRQSPSSSRPLPRPLTGPTLHPLKPTSSRTLFGFSWFASKPTNDTSNQSTNEGAGLGKDSEQQNTTPPRTIKASTSSTSASSPSSPLPSSPTTTSPTSSSSTTPPPSTTPTPPNPPTSEAQERAAIRALLDRDGGELGFEFEDGKPEGGQRRAVKREMFRVI